MWFFLAHFFGAKHMPSRASALFYVIIVSLIWLLLDDSVLKQSEFPFSSTQGFLHTLEEFVLAIVVLGLLLGDIKPKMWWTCGVLPTKLHE